MIKEVKGRLNKSLEEALEVLPYNAGQDTKRQIIKSTTSLFSRQRLTITTKTH